jgi:hypothetical protein
MSSPSDGTAIASITSVLRELSSASEPLRLAAEMVGEQGHEGLSQGSVGIIGPTPRHRYAGSRSGIR